MKCETRLGFIAGYISRLELIDNNNKEHDKNVLDQRREKK
jgi:hypothetical protein